ERVAEVEAAAAAVTDVEDARELGVEGRGVGELRRAPIDRVTRRRLEAAFATRAFVFRHLDSGCAAGPDLTVRAGVSHWMRALVLEPLLEGVERLLKTIGMRALRLRQRLEPI